MSPNPERNLTSLPAAAAAPPEYTEAEPFERAEAGEAEPPRARQVPRVHTVHGESRIDEYFWLRNREDPEVLAHLDGVRSVAEVHGGRRYSTSISPRTVAVTRSPSRSMT